MTELRYYKSFGHEKLKQLTDVNNTNYTQHQLDAILVADSKY